MKLSIAFNDKNPRKDQLRLQRVENHGNAIRHLNAVPTTGYGLRGMVVFNATPAVAATKGWLCTASGTPGTWVSMGTLASRGSTILTATNITASASVYQAVTGTITLPGPDDYDLWADLRVTHDLVANAFMVVRLYDVTAGAAVPNSVRMGVFAPSTGQIQLTIPVRIPYSYTGAGTRSIRAEAFRTNASADVWVASNSNGYSVLGWEQK